MFIGNLFDADLIEAIADANSQLVEPISSTEQLEQIQSIGNGVIKCSICGKAIFDRFSNNPDPVKTGENERCCKVCDNRYVIPARMGLTGLAALQWFDNA